MSDTTDDTTAHEPGHVGVDAEATPGVPVDGAASRWSRPIEIARGALLVGVLLLAWGMILFGGRGEGEDYDAMFRAGYIAMIVALGIITAVALASLRYARVRRALLPFEVGLFVGVAIMFADVRGVEVDTNEDAVFIAILCGIGASLVVAFLNTLLDGYRYRGAWIAGVATVAALIGMSLPVIADGLSSNEVWIAGGNDPYLSSALLTRVTLDGGVRLASLTDGPGGVVEAVPVPVDSSTDPTTPTSVAVAPPVGAGGGLQLVADARGDLRLEVERAMLLPATAASGLLELRRGTCVERSNADVRVDSWRVQNAGRAPARMRVEGLRVDDLRFEDQIYAVFGSGAPLAPVTCIDVIDPPGIALAQAGLARMHAECVAPLVDGTVTPGQLTADSFQDEACADRFEKLVDVVTGSYFTRAEAGAATELARCLERASVSSRVVRVEGGVIVTNVEQSSNPDVITPASACFDEAAPRALASSGYGGAAMLVPTEAPAVPLAEEQDVRSSTTTVPAG